jgi:hypothetical protein
MMNINHSPHVKTTSQQNQTCNSLKKISENKQVNCNWLWSLELTPASATKTINVRSWRTYKQPAVNHQSIPKQAQEKSAPTYVMTTNNQQKNGITNVEKQRSHELTCSCTWGNNNFYDMSPPACQAAIASLVSFGDKTPGL